LKGLLDEGLDSVYRRHTEVAAYCRARLQGMGVALWPRDERYSAPTVTAARVPPAWRWSDLDSALREQGMAVGGSYGPLTDKVFRIGHMGSQADHELVRRGMDVLERILARK
jgi:aspartate aminotransferase-like enzyme